MLTEQALTGLAQRTQGVHYLRRPKSANTPEFDLAYVRTRKNPHYPPAVVIPGGPGLASVLPYLTLRTLAARGGLDLIMIEHRGVGLSRQDIAGRDLPTSAMRITEVMEDINAVLDHENVSRAYIVGSSYGSYLASSFGVAHPERVAGMLLDSALQSANHIEIEREVVRSLLWENTGSAANAVRRLAATGIDQRVLLDVTRAAYELGGDELLFPLLRSRIRSRSAPIWKALEAYATRDASIARIPNIYEFDLAGTIGFRELGYGGKADGLPLDPALTYSPLTNQFPEFVGEPYDLRTGVQGFDWPLVLLSGTRDLRTPPAIAQGVAEAAPNAVVAPITNGHSALDTHPLALLNALRLLVDGHQQQIPKMAKKLDKLPRRGIAARFPQFLRAGLRIGL